MEPRSASRPFRGGDNASVAWSRGEAGADRAHAGTRETELIERARTGEPEAIEELVVTYQDLAVRTAYVIVGDPDEASDAAQEGFVKAFRALSRFRPGAPFRPWLLRIVANEAINRRRAAHRRADLRERASAALPGVPAAGPEESAIDAERRAELLMAVNGLRPEDRLVIAYRYWFELPEAEMAEAMGVARGTVKSRLSRALGRLREALESGAGADGAGRQPESERGEADA
jgi:RNA polymerase sigma factor (sigma-70 family)